MRSAGEGDQATSGSSPGAGGGGKGEGTPMLHPSPLRRPIWIVVIGA